MEPISVILLLAGAGAIARLITNDGHLTTGSRLNAENRQRYARIQQQLQRRAVVQNRQFQAAILALDSNPDFQRVASAVRAAAQVPTSFKLRQYHRFRPHFVRHYRRCIQRGGDLQQLRSSLDQLVMSFELEPFEAEYLRTEAEQNLPVPQQPGSGTPADEFRNRLSQIHEEHQQRMNTIREVTGVADDVREQLLEAEERRYQSKLFQDDSRSM